jgi:hypothetical protein
MKEVYMKKRCLAALCALFMAAAALSAQTAADFQYTAANGEVTITGYTGQGGAVIIPGTIGGKPVTGIGDRAFTTTTAAGT